MFTENPHRLKPVTVESQIEHQKKTKKGYICGKITAF